MPALFDDRSRQYLVNALRSKVPQWLEDAAAGVDDARKYVSGLMSENYGKARTAAEVASMIPTPIGDAASAALALDDLRKGDYGSAALNSLGLLPLVPSLAGVTVWHGSPHKFAPTPKNPLGEFDLSKIGTGEGAQAYGHGLYVAESPDVAKTYVVDQRGMSAQGLANRWLQSNAAKGDYNKAIELGQKMLANAERDFVPEAVEPYRNAINMLKTRDITGGSLYKVDLPDDQVAKMLDWDKPLSQQPPGVFDALLDASPLGRESEIRRVRAWSNPGWAGGGNVKYEDAISAGTKYNALAADLGSYAKASEALRQAGIPGIRYLDQGSRASGAGTSNYVVFDPSILNILERQ